MARTAANAPRSSTGTIRTIGCTAAAVIVLFAVVGGIASGFVVQAGNVGVVTTFGKVEDGVLYPGFHLRVPFITQIHQIDVRVQPHAFQEIDAASLEQQSVKLTGTMNYHLDAARANQLFQNVGLDFATKVIDPAFNDYIKEVVPRYRASEILQKRDEIRNTTKDKLSTNLERYGIIVDDIYISNIAFSPEYQQAIEQKQTQQQNVGREEQLLAQKQIQAQQRVVEARGEAEAAVESAKGEAESNRIRAQSITPALVEYLQVSRWDGRLPQVTGGAVPMFDVGGLSGAEPTATAQPTVLPTPPPTPTSQPTPISTPTAAP